MVTEFLYGSVLGAGAKKLTEKLVDSVYPKLRLTKGTKEDIQKSVILHMEATYEKCFYLKTILRDRREVFSEIYSDQGFFLPNDQRINQNKLVEYIKNGNTVVIQGTGGGGKSMFVRYLWLYYFAQFRENFPVFIELRNLNGTLHPDFTISDLETYIFHSVVSNSTTLSQRDFTDLVRNGKVVLFLDGFDEINHQYRDVCQRAIIGLKEKNPRTTFVVTSREDERFIAWHQFHTIRVAPLTKEECVNLLNKAPFDVEQRKKIVKKVSETLYDSHTSFLSNPLLAYMTMVTYAYNPNFSDKMVQFYELAFEALYYRHDLTKGGGYNRRFYTNLDKNQFQKLLSYFCLRTYYDQKLEYDARSLNQYIDEVRRIEPSLYEDIDNKLFIKDIMESVCILKKDGIEFTYTHRKFQEYFAAYCISRVASRNLTKMFQNFSRRYTDDVLVMVYDLNPDLFREKYIKPLYQSHKRFFDLKSETAIVKNFSKLTNYCYDLTPFFGQSRVNRMTGKNAGKDEVAQRESITINSSGPLNDMVKALERLYDRRGIYQPNGTKTVERDEELIISVRKETGIRTENMRLVYENGELVLYVIKDARNPKMEIVKSTIFDKNRGDMLLKTIVEKEAIEIHRFVNAEIGKFDGISSTFSEYFD